MSSRLLRRTAAITSISALTLLGVAGPAAAHVTVNPLMAEQGSWSKVSFRVPNERDNASTTKLVVELPADHPIAFVSVRPTPGWRVKADKTTLPTPVKTEDGEITKAVTRITWEGGTIAPGQFEEFDVSLGPLPTGTDTLMFKADQTYSGGEVVHWNEPPEADGSEPEHPAPVLKLTKPGAAAAAPSTRNISAALPDADSSDGVARTMAAIGLAAGLLGLILGALALANRRRTP